MRGLVLASAVAVGLAAPSVAAEDGPLRHAFMACIAQAVELDMLADMLVLTNPAGKRSATLVCSGPPAGDLFSAMNGVSEQTVYGEVVIRSSGLGVRCMKPSTDNGNCLVNIETGVPFLDGLRRQ
jgi:hypothetical protein